MFKKTLDFIEKASVEALRLRPIRLGTAEACGWQDTLPAAEATGPRQRRCTAGCEGDRHGDSGDGKERI